MRDGRAQEGTCGPDDSLREKLFEEGLATLPAEIRDDVRTRSQPTPKKRRRGQRNLPTSSGGAEAGRADVAKKLDADAEFKPKQQKLGDAIKAIEKQTRTFPEIRAFYDLPGDAKTHLLRRGEYTQPGPEVTPGVLRVLANPRRSKCPRRPKDAKTSGRRLAFAKWLTSPEHPLTARVIVNRLWLHHFGQGLVATPDNFGKTGSPPVHPELLDWLASEFMAPTSPARGAPGDGKWSIKRMHRLIVTSAAYKQIF